MYKITAQENFDNNQDQKDDKEENIALENDIGNTPVETRKFLFTISENIIIVKLIFRQQLICFV